MSRVLTTSWSPLPHQSPVLANDTGVDFVIAGLGAGKSQVAAQKLLTWCLRYPRDKDGRPARALVLGKDFREAVASQFSKILDQVRALPLPESAIVEAVVGAPAPTIRLHNGVTIEAFSGTDPNATRAHEFEYAWVDEAEYMSAESFANALARMRAAVALRMIVTSSPDGAGWIYPVINGEYEEWRDFRERVPLRVHRWKSSSNTTNRREVLDGIAAAQNAVRPQFAVQELEGRFLGTAEAPGSGAIEYVPAFVGELVLSARPYAEVVGADLGKAVDFCWFTGLSPAGVAIAMDRFNLSEVDAPAEGYWPLVADRLIRFSERLGARRIVLDAAKGGDQFAALLREKLKGRGVLVEEVGTDAPGKKAEIIEALGMAIPMGRVKVPTSWRAASGESASVEHVEKLRIEFKKLVTQTLPGGKRRFGHPAGGHDDGVVSLALAWHGLAARPVARRNWSSWKHDAPPQRFGAGGSFRGGDAGRRF